MKKNYTLLHDDVIDLAPLFKIIWNEKKKIVLITIISFLIGIGYLYRLPNIYISSLVIKPIHNSEYIKILSILELIEFNKKNINYYPNSKNNINNTYSKNNINSKYKINNEIILDKFIYELKDYEEFLFILKDNLKPHDKENISKLPIDEQKKALFKYTNLFEIIKSKKDETHLILNLKWTNPIKASDILKHTTNLAINNLEKSIYKDLYDLVEMNKKLIQLENMKKIQYLSEQSLIAKEIDISDNQLNNINALDYTAALGEEFFLGYLRGYKAIDKEIDLIKKRRNEEIDYIAKEISFLKETKINWVHYDVNSINSILLRDTKLILTISVLLGLMIGTLYVITFSKFINKQYLKKKSS